MRWVFVTSAIFRTHSTRWVFVVRGLPCISGGSVGAVMVIGRFVQLWCSSHRRQAPDVPTREAMPPCLRHATHAVYNAEVRNVVPTRAARHATFGRRGGLFGPKLALQRPDRR